MASLWNRCRLASAGGIPKRWLPDETRRSYDHEKAALLRRFEPKSKHNFYTAEFLARWKLPSEDWATFADDLNNLADNMLPDLDDTTRARLAVDYFLPQITDIQLAFSIRQKQLTSIKAAAATTLELQSHLSLANTASRPSDLPVDAVHHGRPTQPDGTTRLLEQLVSEMENYRQTFLYKITLQ